MHHSTQFINSYFFYIDFCSEIWQHFDGFSQHHLASMACRLTFVKTGPDVKPDLYNSGVMFMDLENIRRADWMDNLTAIMHRQSSDESVHRLGDQSILNEYFSLNHDKLFTMRYVLICELISLCVPGHKSPKI